MIVQKDGRAWSQRTPEEAAGLLKKDLAGLNPAERETLEILLQELSTPAAASPEKKLLQLLGNAEYKRTPVDMRTFCLDPYYLGHTCDNIYPKLLDDLTDLMSGDYHECILSGSIGWGKTFFASIGICRILYELSCMTSPHDSFGLGRDTNISIVNLSVSEALAVKVVFENVATKIKASPYFKEHFPFEATKKELRFPSNVWVAARATSDTSALGLNIISALMDECLVGDAKVLLADGREARVDELCRVGEAVVVTFDFHRNCSVYAQAFFKSSTEQECFELVLDNGSRLRASGTHPVAVRRNGVFRFITMSGIMDGEEVVAYAPMDGGAQKGTRGEAAAAVAGGAVLPTVLGVDGGATTGRLTEDDGPDFGGGASGAAAYGRAGEPPTRDTADSGGEGTHRKGPPGAQGVGRDAAQDVRGSTGPTDAHRGVQARLGGAQSHAGLSAHGRVAEAYQRGERLEDQARGLSLPWICRDEEGREDRIPERLGATGGGVDGAVSGGVEFRVREAGGALHLRGAEAVDAAGLCGGSCERECAGDRGQASGVHEPSEGEGQDARRSALLREARLGVCGLGRTLTVARVVSKKRLGVLPTYDVSVPGYECFIADGVLVHNTNFMPQPQQRRAAGMRWEHTSRADTLYAAIQRRMKSRFQRQGRLPGILFIVSSKRTSHDFTAQRVREARNDPTVFVRDYPLWGVKPEAYYTTQKFWVLCGNETIPSKIVPNEEVEALRAKLPEETVIIDVPEDFRADFERDLEGSLRDLAGVATVAISPYIQRREKIEEAIDLTRIHPFSKLVHDPSKPGQMLWDHLVKESTARNPGGVSFKRLRPLLNPTAARHVHIDPSLSGDATGLCMAHIGGFKDVVRRVEGGREFMERAPLYIVDFLLRIVPPVGGEIELGDVRQFVYDLTAHGFLITSVTLDSFQSADAIQQLSKKGYTSARLSVDTHIEPYDNLKTALYENRVLYYNYPPLIDELRTVEHIREKNKVDHPAHGTKDVADAVAGCLYTLSQKQVSQPLPILRGTGGMTGEVWMDEQRQAALAGNPEAMNNRDVLPPFLVGSGGSDDWGSGWSPR
jgi:hypothetical protein